MSERAIAIQWRGQNPDPEVKSLFVWHESTHLKPNPLEGKLAWPQGTIEILHKACEQKLGRGQGWIAPVEPAFKQAAQVFKRGVLLNSEKSIQVFGEYKIIECQNSELGEMLSQSNCIILDRNVYNYWPRLFTPEITKRCLIVDASEQSKNLDAVAEVFSSSLFREATECCIVGGGVLGDIASFAAALGGKKFAFVPTTLLSMIDSSVGGKTGVNLLPFGKNLIGSFAFPSAVYIYADFLQTLPVREWQAGQMEALKHAILKGDKKLFAEVDGLSPRENMPWQMLASLIQIKADVIQKDPFDQGSRVSLNLGHTLGHALEAFALQENIELKHGEAVGMGLMFAIYLSQDLNLMHDDGLLKSMQTSRTWQAIRPLWHSLLASTESRKFTNDIVRYLANDKKNGTGDEVHWILPTGWGQLAGSDPHHVITVNNDQVLKTLARFTS